MARARNIKPGFFSNDELVELPFEYRLLFIGLWTVADREGRLLDRPKKIKMDVFPADDVNVERGLSQLAAAGFIERYDGGGMRCIQINNWHKHQNPHVREAPGTIAPPDREREAPDHDRAQQDRTHRQAPDEHHASTVPAPGIPERAGLIPDSGYRIADTSFPIADPGNRTATVLVERDGFARFWDAYPKKAGRGDAEKAFRKLNPAPALLTTMLHAVEAARNGEEWKRNSGQFIPNPATWLSGRRWEDEVRSYCPETPTHTAHLGKAGRATAAAATRWLADSNA